MNSEISMRRILRPRPGRTKLPSSTRSPANEPIIESDGSKSIHREPSIVGDGNALHIGPQPTGQGNNTEPSIEGDGSASHISPQPTGQGTRKKGRGKAKNEALYVAKERYGKGVPVPVEFEPEYLKPVGLNDKLWTAEIGIQARKIKQLLLYKTWKDVPDHERQVCYDHFKDTFGVDALANTEDFKRVNKGLANCLRKYRAKLKKYFDEQESVEIARRNPCDDIDIDVWQVLCDRWLTAEFQDMSAKNKVNRSKNEDLHFSGSRSFVKRYDGYRKQGQSEEDEEASSNQLGPAILTYKDTHFKEGKGWINEKAKRNYDAMIEKSAQVFSDGTSAIGNDVEIVHNLLGIKKGYPRGFGYGFVVASRQRASLDYEEASRKRAEIAEEKNAQLVEEVTKMREEMSEIKQMLLAQQQQPQPPPPCFHHHCQHYSQQQQVPSNWYQQPPSILRFPSGRGRRRNHGGSISTTTTCTAAAAALPQLAPE